MTNILKINYPEWNATNQEYEYKSINLLPYADISGMALTSWTAGQQAYNSGNVFPPRFQSVTENISVDISGYDQDDVLLELKQFYQAATAIAEYWLELDPTIPAPYLEAKADKEDNSRYAVITERPSFTTLGKPVEQPFYNLNSSILENVTLSISRLAWRSNVPGEGECVELSSLFDWDYTDPFVADYTQASSSVVFLVSTGTLLSGDDGNFGRIYRSTNDGDSAFTQVYIGGAGDIIFDFVEADNGNLFAADFSNDQLLRSVDDGQNWAAIAGTFDAPSRFFKDETGRIWLTGFNSATNQVELYYSDNDGSTWTNSTIVTPLIGSQGSEQLSIIKIPNTNILFIGTGDAGLIRSTDNSTTWEYYPIPSPDDDDIENIIIDSFGNIIVTFQNSAISVSSDNGETWTLYITPNGGFVDNIVENNGEYYIFTGAGSSAGSMYRSIDFLYWQPVETSDLAFGGAVITDDNAILWSNSGGGASFTKYSLDTAIELGVDSQCFENVIANKNVISNITHLKWNDTTGATFDDLFPAAAFPFDLVTVTPIANGDALYFITDTSLDKSGPFSNVAFNLSARFLPPGAFIAWEWEYYNGAWVSLTVLDQTFEFQKTGVLVVSFEIPSDWTTVTIDGVTGYAIRAEYAANVTPIQVQEQDIRNVYFAQKSYVDIPELSGDLDAITKLIVENICDNDGRGGSGPDLYSNRIIAGRRKLSRGENFSAYLNVVDTSGDTGQNHQNVTVTYGANVSSVSDVQSPVGLAARYNPAGAEAMADRATWNLNGILGLEYTGDFHCYARVHRTAGSVSDFDVQLKVEYGSGGLEFTTDSVQVQTTTKFELLDFGTITVPQFDTLTDELKFTIQVSAASGTPNLDIFDFIPLPVDEWAGDFIDSANVSGSETSLNESLEIDGLKPLDVPVVIKNVSGAIKSEYETSGPTLYIEPLPDDTQRLHFLQAQASATGNDFAWIAKPEICSLVTIEHNPGYMGFIK